MSTMEVILNKDGTPRKKMGRPRITPVEEEVRRQRMLVRARNRAYSILAQRYPDEFMDLKNALLVRWGESPIDPSFQNRQPTVDETTAQPGKGA